MTALRDRAEAAEMQVWRLQEQIRHAQDCLFTAAVNETVRARANAAKHGEFDRAVDHSQGVVSGYIGGLYFLTHEDQTAIQARVEKAADELQAKQAAKVE